MAPSCIGLYYYLNTFNSTLISHLVNGKLQILKVMNLLYKAGQCLTVISYSFSLQFHNKVGALSPN